ncbi:heat shock protein 90 [Legionella moravica]|uniref:Chaperone protein HtpG n=1 Tax=Legionella moravica TaxID=39962 RepID=A0A378JWB3_9GAMM|nr:molecular chaperone HtpG [Legionella moravica]KTD34181.1 heat shock protein 90 [Legionella moravica]STX62943.1 molecular chaperone HtpG [Legionella moravica]
MVSKQQTMGFQTEVKQMLHLVVHSLYSNKEIFLRELISNSSDALDKLRFLALSDSTLFENDSDLKITIQVNEKLKTITISDNGIGMSWDEAVENLGTIAKSGTKEFMSRLTGEQSKDSQLIGQFGVGFYSAFIVADKVTVKSRRAGMKPEEGIVWESTGDGEFTIGYEKKASRGTEITLHVKDENDEFLSNWRIRSIISKYSDHICWPIEMKKISDEDNESKESKESSEFETVNKATALWTMQKPDISDEEYKTLYKHISHDYMDPLSWSHNHVEGKHEYITLLYIPSHAPYDLWQHEVKHGLKLYVKRVFIMDDATQFLPRYLRFVKGIVDASDLPLNVSREILQDNKQVESIRAACTKRILSMLEKMSANDKETYQKFWDEFGLVLKEGPVEDFSNKEAISKLLRFATTTSGSEKQDVSLEEYVSRMKEGQDKIYYITASSYNAAKNSPHLEIFKKKGIEVLLLSDKIDEWLVGYMNEFAGKKLQSISKGKVEFNDDESAEQIKEQEKTLEPVIKHIKTILNERVKDVLITNRLTDSPACIIADEQDMGLEMQRILQAAGQQVPVSKPIFEINPEHALIKRLHDIQDDSQFELWVTMLFEQAVLAEGGQLDNPADFVNRVNKLLVSS